MNLKDHLSKSNAPTDVQKAILAGAKSGERIYQAFKEQKIEYSSSENSSGETQLSHDLIADEILKEELQASGAVSCFVSEERESDVCFINHEPDKLLVAFDPVDGSSVAGAGQAVGTSIGIYRGVEKFTDATGRHQVASMYTLYGPRILLIYSVGNGVHVFAFDEKTGEFILEQEKICLCNPKKVCGFGGMQHSCAIGGFPDLIRHWERQKYSLRYSGSMAADINGILLRGGGIFVYPAPKLRMLYECNPFAFLIEQAGGKATDLAGRPILEKSISKIDDTSPVIIGTTEQVDQAVDFFTDLSKQTGCII